MGDPIKISIQEISKEHEEEIVIKCHELDDEIYEIANKLRTETAIILGYQDERVSRIKLSQIYYFEGVDGKVFAYAKDDIHEVKQKLYELEEMCEDKNYFRASKSTILNIAKIETIHPSLSGRFVAVLDNEERVVISRKYVPILKNMLGL